MKYGILKEQDLSGTDGTCCGGGAVFAFQRAGK